MKPLDVKKYIGTSFVSGSVFPVVHALAFEHTEKAFTSRIIGTMSDSM
jgi:hypothetical protein